MNRQPLEVNQTRKKTRENLTKILFSLAYQRARALFFFQTYDVRSSTSTLSLRNGQQLTVN